MTDLAITRTNLRSYSAIIANILAVALAVAIPLSNAMTTVISLLLAIFCIMQMDKFTWNEVLKHPATIAILIYVSLSIIDVTYSIAGSKEILQALRKTSRLLYFPLLLPIFAQPKWRHAAVIAFLTVLLFSVIVAIYAGWVVFKDTIFTSFFVAFAIFTLAHYSVDHKKFRSVTIPLAIFFTFYILFLGHGRTGQVLFIMLFMLFCWQRFSHNLKAQIGAILVLMAMIAASLLSPSSFVARHTVAMREIKQYAQIDEAEIPHESSMGTRLILAHNTWELIKQKPILGWGTGSFRVAYAKFAPEAQVKDVERTNPHDQYLLTWAELGILGLISLLYLFYSLGMQFLKTKRLTGYLGVGLVCAMMLGCTMNSWLLDFTSAFFFVFFAAVFAGDRRTV